MNSSEDRTTTLEIQSNCGVDREQDITEEIDYPVFVTILQIIVSCLLINICCVVGIVGNIVTVIVLCSNRFKDTSSIMLLSMAACDIFYLLTLSARKLDCVFKRIDSCFAQIYEPYVTAYVREASRMPILISMSHLVLISSERLVAVYYSLQVSRLCTRKRVVYSLVSIYTFWIAVCLPWATLRYEVEWLFSQVYNRSLPFLQETQWFKENSEALDILFDLVINPLSGLLSVVVAANCCAVACKLYSVSKKRASLTAIMSNKKESKDSKVSRMLLVVCVVFCICNLPGVGIYLYFYTDPLMVSPNILFSLLGYVDDFLLAVNSAANFFIYVLMSSKFYKSVMKLFGCRGKEKKLGHSCELSSF